MKDKLNNEIQDGDLIIQVNYDTPIPGVIHGGFTKGGKIRYIDWQGRKQNVHKHNIIVVQREQIENFCNERVEWARERLAQIENVEHEQRIGYNINYYLDMTRLWPTTIARMFEINENR